MLQSQNSKKISELQGILKNKSSVVNTIFNVFQDFNVCKALQDINMYKDKGIKATHIISTLLLIPFLLEETIHSLVKSPITLITDKQKDVFYRLKNNENIDWRKLMFSIANRSRKIIMKASIKPDEPPKDIIFNVKCLVFDDTVIKKTGYKIEGIGKVFDHVCNTYVLGLNFYVAVSGMVKALTR